MSVLIERLHQPMVLLLLQMAVIVIAARLVGQAVKRLGQPAVIGEMLAGILLGPSLLGLLSPGLLQFLFPPASLDVVQRLSQLGVVLFMLLLGAELDAAGLRRRAPQALLISACGIALPLALGLGFAWATADQLAPAGVSHLNYALFLGVAMSITAFPVLARILQERRLLETPLGQKAIACAAIEDVTAWCLLAAVVAVATAGGFAGALRTLLLALGFVLAMFLFVAPRAARGIERHFVPASDNRGLMVTLLVFVLLCAAFTQAIGIHPFFGAFVAGAILPARAAFQAFLRERVETVCSVLLLPLFFALTGLRTEIGLLQGWNDWLLCGAVIGLAIAGKFIGCTLAARASGGPWRESLALGTLLNTRGLMELIVLNVGYDLGLLSPRVFTMFVLMALVTTFMTGPVLGLILGRRNGARSLQ